MAQNWNHKTLENPRISRIPNHENPRKIKLVLNYFWSMELYHYPMEITQPTTISNISITTPAGCIRGRKRREKLFLFLVLWDDKKTLIATLNCLALMRCDKGSFIPLSQPLSPHQNINNIRSSPFQNPPTRELEGRERKKRKREKKEKKERTQPGN